MRSKFGRKALALRVARGLSQTAFSEQTGWSLSRISNIEYDRAAISDDVLRVYLKVLQPSGEDAIELRKLAGFGNSVRKKEKDGVPHPPIVALFEQFGHSLSPKAVAKIQEIIERETGETVSELRFSSNQTRTTKPLTNRKRPSLSTSRLVEICIIASRFRQRYASETSRVNIADLLERLASDDISFDYRISELLPAHLKGAFACLIGESDGHILLLEESRFMSAEKGVHFARHVIAHEIGHHVLHAQELVSDGELVFSPQSLAMNSSRTIGSTRPIKQVVENLLEVEAECFATFFLVPWEAYVKGIGVQYLATDFGEQLEEVKRYYPYFKLDAVVDEFKRQLWQMGENSHPIFTHSPL